MNNFADVLKSIADTLSYLPAEQMRVKLYTAVDALDGVPDYYQKELLTAIFLKESK
jgi:hypothetical protein